MEGAEEDGTFGSLFGPTAFTLKLGDAIEQGIVCDYRVFLPMLHEVGQEREISVESGLLDEDVEVVARASFLIKTMLMHGARKTIVYLQTHEQVEVFYHVLVNVAKKYFGLGDAFWASSIISSDSLGTRQDRLQRFASANDYAVMLNVHVLNECVDIPRADSVFFAFPCKNKIRCVQRVCRANRLDSHNPGKVTQILLWSSEEDDCLHFVAAMKEVDPLFCKKISVVSRRYEKLSAAKKEELAIATIDLGNWCVGVKEYKISDREARALQQARAYAAFFNAHERQPSQQATDKDERSLGLWIYNFKQGTSLGVALSSQSMTTSDY